MIFLAAHLPSKRAVRVTLAALLAGWLTCQAREDRHTAILLTYLAGEAFWLMVDRNNLLLTLTVALTMTASSSIRLELFRVAAGRSSPLTRLY
jgi:hypothetical protein